MAGKRKRKCPVCGLFVWGKPHTGPMHDRILRGRRRRRRR
jgi:hypothetical protein